MKQAQVGMIGIIFDANLPSIWGYSVYFLDEFFLSAEANVFGNLEQWLWTVDLYAYDILIVNL